MGRIDANQSLSLKPLGAGDLIDRAVRFYRGNFWVFLVMAGPPVVLGTLLSFGWAIAGRELFAGGGGSESIERTVYYIFLWLGSIGIWLVESIATLVVMGGASRGFVRHLLFGEPITVRATYQNAWNRLGGLTAASTIIGVFLGILGLIFFYFALTITVLAVVFIAWAFSSIPFVAVILSIAVGGALISGAIWLYFLVASRFAYVPQVMLVEGLGVFAAIGRSASLASGSVKRLVALFVFTIVATLSALAILYVPLTWYAWASGVEVMSQADLVPAWLEISYNLIWQISFILLSPVWMIGLCLLYVDERVRSEGYDIELMAARRLGEMPDVPLSYINPLQPALSANARIDLPPPPAGKPDGSILGLG